MDASLNVANILDGSVRKSDDHLRFSVQAGAGQHRHGGPGPKPMTGKSRIFSPCRMTWLAPWSRHSSCDLLPSEHIPAGERTANAQAYEQYLQGLKLNESYSVDNMRRGIAAFEKAVELDPKFASGYAQIALSAAEIGGMTVDSAMYELARSRADQAIALAPGLATAYVARANVRMYNDWNFAGAKQDLDTALGIEPNNSEVQKLQINYLLAIGKPADALAVRKREVERNPLSATAWSRLAQTYMECGTTQRPGTPSSAPTRSSRINWTHRPGQVLSCTPATSRKRCDRRG